MPAARAVAEAGNASIAARRRSAASIPLQPFLTSTAKSADRITVPLVTTGSPTARRIPADTFTRNPVNGTTTASLTGWIATSA